MVEGGWWNGGMVEWWLLWGGWNINDGDNKIIMAMIMAIIIAWQ